MPEKYKLIDNIGGREDIRLVFDEVSSSVYVEKILNVYDTEIYERLKSLQNIHIPRVIDYRVEDQKLVLVEEYIQGETLEELKERGYIFLDDDILRIVNGIIDALDFLHGQDPPIIHRDIKPSNVMIDRDQVVILIDFNVARQFDKSLSRDTRFMGTAEYAAPEQYGFAQSDKRTDIYALGVLINHLITGANPSEKLCSGPWRAIVEKCTYLDPNKRYSDVGALRNDISAMVKPDDAQRDKIDGKRALTFSDIVRIPGFRSGKPGHMLIALLGYSLIFAIALELETDAGKAHQVMLYVDRIGFLAFALFSVALLTDYLGIDSLLPLAKRKNGKISIPGVFLWIVVGFFLYCTVSLLIEHALFS